MNPTQISAMRSGDTEARNALWLAYEPLIRKVVARFAKPPAPLCREDVRDVATDALFVAMLAPDFDPHRPDAAGYLRQSMCRAVLMEIRRVTGRGRRSERSMEEPVAENLTLGETLADTRDGIGAAEARALLAQLEPVLLANQRRVLRLRAQGWRVREIAAMEKRTAARIEGTMRAIQRKAARRFTPLASEADIIFGGEVATKNGPRFPHVETFTADDATRQILSNAAHAAGLSRSAWLRAAIRAQAAACQHTQGG